MTDLRRPENFLLQALSEADYALLSPHLKPVELVQNAVLFETAEPIRRVYFPNSGIISIVVELSGGQTVEAAMIGRDTVAGAAFAMDGKISLNKAIVNVPGTCTVIEVEKLRAAADQSKTLRAALICYEQIVFAQSQQAAACHAVHTLEQRLARWLLYVRDLVDGETLQLTQEFLGQILGVQRTSVSLVAQRLQDEGLISYRRGQVRISHVEKLRAVSCECYGAVGTHRERLLNEI
jgi:CRP-like cAMP-binding protein